MAKKKNKNRSNAPKQKADKQNLSQPKIAKPSALTAFFKKYWQEKSPVFKFIAGFALCIIAFYALYYSSWFETNFKEPILTAQAMAGGALLNLFGFSVNVVDEVISGNGATVQIAGGCDGLEATALFLAAIFVFPLPFKFKWPGLIAGLLVLSLLNVFRIAGLYLTQQYWPEAFDFMHVQGGLYLYSIVTILLMLVWADWALRNYKKERVAVSSATQQQTL